MNIVRKPFVAYLIAFFAVALSTGYLVLIYEETTQNNPEEVVNNDLDEEPEGIFGDYQEDVVEEMRKSFARLAQEYDGDVTIVSNAISAIAPSLNSFIPTPVIIYNTLGSENGFINTYMVVEGEVKEWTVIEGFTQMILSNEDGEIHINHVEPLVDNSLSAYQAMLPDGTNVRVYFQYSGFSLLFDRAAGIIIGFVILDEADSATDVEAETETEEDSDDSDDADVDMEFRNALDSARNYLSFMSFSFESLSGQLDFEGYSQEAIEWAMEQIDDEVDWYEQAVSSAENYIDLMSFSRSGLIEQLIFEGFTRSQAEHAAEVAFD